MIPSSLSEVAHKIVLDGEYVADPGEPFDLVALGMQEVGTDEVRVYTRTELQQWTALPFACDSSTMIVSYNAAAESGFLHALGLGMPVLWFDLMAQSRVMRNVCIAGKFLQPFAKHHPEIYKPNRDISLLETAELFGVAGGDSDYKEVSRDLILSRQWESGSVEVWQQICDYCASDVRLTMELFLKMEPHIDLQAALVFGRYAAEQGRMEQRGIPVDRATLGRLRHEHKALLQRYREGVDPDSTRLTPRGRIRQQWLTGKLAALGLSHVHQRTPAGKVSLKASCLAETAEQGDSELQAIAQWAELLKIFLEGKDGELRLPPMGLDGRVRYGQFPFATNTGRSLGRGSVALMQMSQWLRGLVQPHAGEVLLCADYSAEEFAVAAGLSGDAHMREAYLAGDPYVEVARMAGALTPDMDKARVRQVRKIYKDLTLGRMYGLGFVGFRQKAGVPYGQAVTAWQFFERQFGHFREWQRRTVAQARRKGWISTRLGWKARVYPSTRDTSLMNWAVQAGAADVLRVAVLMLAEAKVDLLMSMHDALLVSCREGESALQKARVISTMQEAAEIAVGLPIRVDVQTVEPNERLLTEDTAPQWQRVMDLLTGAKLNP